MSTNEIRALLHESIEKSKTQIADGQFLTNSQADQLVEKWLNE